jgi:hypothetical protein
MNPDFIPIPLRIILLILLGAQYLFNALQAFLGLLHSRKHIAQKPRTKRKPRLSNNCRSRFMAKNIRRKAR